MHVHWGLWRVLRGETNGETPGRGVSCDVWSRGEEGRAGERVLGELGQEAKPSSQSPDPLLPHDLRSPSTPSLPQAAGA